MIDAPTRQATQVFIARIVKQFDMVEAVLFGSRARLSHAPNSDADIAVILRGPHGRRTDAAMTMADVAFDVMLETGILIEPLPLWENEWIHPEQFNNPELIENIQREGIRL